MKKPEIVHIFVCLAVLIFSFYCAFSEPGILRPSILRGYDLAIQGIVVFKGMFLIFALGTLLHLSHYTVSFMKRKNEKN